MFPFYRYLFDNAVTVLEPGFDVAIDAYESYYRSVTPVYVALTGAVLGSLVVVMAMQGTAKQADWQCKLISAHYLCHLCRVLHIWQSSARC